MRGDICALCCGNEREQTVHCPLDCEYLQEGRKREKQPVADPDAFPNQDIRVTAEFLRKNEVLLLFISHHLLEAAIETPDLVDRDLKDALDALVRTYRTRQSGLYYDSRPANAIAAAVCDRIHAAVDTHRKSLAQRLSVSSLRDLDILGILVFLQRMEIQHNNGRRLGRAFIDFLRAFFPEIKQAVEPSPLIV